MDRPGAAFARTYPADTPVAIKPNGHGLTWLMGRPVSPIIGITSMTRLTVQFTKTCKVVLQVPQSVILAILALLL